MKIFKNKFNAGLTLVEVLIATSIIMIFLVALLSVHSLYLKTALSNGDAIQATFLAEESIEVMRFLRDSSWDNNIVPLALGTNYGLVWYSNTWQASTTNTWIDGSFVRTAAFFAVYRDSNRDIVVSGGTLDPNTRLLVATVSWANNGATTTKSISTYLTDLNEN